MAPCRCSELLSTTKYKVRRGSPKVFPERFHWLPACVFSNTTDLWPSTVSHADRHAHTRARQAQTCWVMSCRKPSEGTMRVISTGVCPLLRPFGKGMEAKEPFATNCTLHTLCHAFLVLTASCLQCLGTPTSPMSNICSCM